MHLHKQFVIKIINWKQVFWQKWMAFAQILGTIQMIILLSIIYWVLIPIVAITFRFISDPLGLKDPNQSKWVKRRPQENLFESMKNQF